MSHSVIGRPDAQIWRMLGVEDAPKKKLNIAIVSLGCPKNQVDADVFCRSLLDAGHTTVNNMEEADVVIINTCGFIQSAKEEAIEYILDACALKKEKAGLKVIVTGCLAERYREQVAAEIPEVDAVVGIGSNSLLDAIVRESIKQPSLPAATPPGTYFGPKGELPLGTARVIGTPKHYAWLKISEGCSNACSYCAIPMIRGPLRSRSIESCVKEAKWLAQNGVRELVLVAQDVTAFGDDRGKNEIAPLLDELNRIEGLHWIRLLYAYPERITEEFLNAVARNKKVVHYFDIPIQHINNEILKSMRRRGDTKTIRGAIKRVREKLPDAVLRTTLITGYPGESEEAFAELCDFVREAQFNHLGCFAYSPEEGTPAAQLSGQLPEETKQKRADLVMLIQSEIASEKQEAMVGRRIEVIVDGYDENQQMWACRSYADAPEIDGLVWLEAEQELEQGSIHIVTVISADIYDLYSKLS